MSLMKSFKTMLEKKPVVQDRELFRHLQEVYPTLNEAAGRQLQLMDPRAAQYLAYYHIVAASKFVPETLPVT